MSKVQISDISSQGFDNKDYLLLAKIAQQTERYTEMVYFVNFFAKSDEELNNEQRNIISAAYKNVVGNKRAELRVLTAIEHKQSQQNQETLQYIRTYKTKIERELKESCEEVLDLIDNHLLKKSIQPQSRVFYLKMKGDYNRYLAEFLVDSEYTEALTNGKHAYTEAIKVANENLESTDPVKLGLLLNYAVFTYEILQLPSEAKKISERAFEEAIANITSVNEDQYKDCTLIMQLLRDNITLWGNDEQLEDENN